MKSPSNQNNRPQNAGRAPGPLDNNRSRPENKDNLDSREGEEQETKGQDVTHNKKQTKEKHLKQKHR